MLWNYCYIVNRFFHWILQYNICKYYNYTFAINCIAWTQFKSYLICDSFHIWLLKFSINSLLITLTVHSSTISNILHTLLMYISLNSLQRVSTLVLTSSYKHLEGTNYFLFSHMVDSEYIISIQWKFCDCQRGVPYYFNQLSQLVPLPGIDIPMFLNNFARWPDALNATLRKSLSYAWDIFFHLFWHILGCHSILVFNMHHSHVITHISFSEIGSIHFKRSH